MKIFHIVEYFGLGGLENGVVNLINQSNPDRFSHEICCIKRSGKSKDRLNFKIPIFVMNKRDRNDWKTIIRLVKLIRKQRPDIVHTRNWGTSDGILAARLAGVRKVVHSEHGWSMSDPTGKNVRRKIVRRVFSIGVSKFVAVSEDMGRWLHEDIGIRRKKIQVIINGVDIHKFTPAIRNVAKNRLRLNGDVIIGTVARLDPIKRHDILLKAFSEAIEEYPNARLLVIGDGPEKQKLEKIWQNLPNQNQITFLGERLDIAQLYQSMDVFVLASQNEGISNTILEAMASGLPVIATSVGGNREVVTPYKTGLLVPPVNVEALKNAILYYIENPEEREKHGKNARIDAVKRFSLEKMSKKYESLYASLVV
jgi:sugar transferase (PEP-CTERM/EpsH1 system associated)